MSGTHLMFLTVAVCVSAPLYAEGGDRVAGGESESSATVGLYGMIERTFTSDRVWRNGFLQVDVDVMFTQVEDPKLTLVLPAFWNGKDSAGHDRFTVRFAPTRTGEWTYRSGSRQDPSLDGLTGPDGRVEIIRATSSTGPGFIRRGESFDWRYSDGTRFFPVGTTAYEWVGSQCAEGPALDYVVEFVQTHFNKVRMSYMSARLSDNAFGGSRKLAAAKENGWHWYSDLSDVDSRVVNLEHWHRLDGIVRSLHAAGVHVELILARRNPLGHQMQGDWVRGVSGPPGAEGLIGNKGIRYFVGRYAAFPLVWWCIGNEWPEAGLTAADIRRIGEEIKALDPYEHPLSAHWNDQWLFGGQDWASHGILQTHVSEGGVSRVNRNVVELRDRHGIAFVNAEYGYEDRQKNTPETVLKAHWAIVLGGGCGDYGHSPTRLGGKYMWAGLDQYWEEQGRPSPPPASVTEVAAGQDAAAGMRVMRDWMNSGKVGYWRMHPANELVGGGADNRFCLAAPGAEYLVSGEGGPIRVDLSAAAGNDLPVTEMNPATGDVRTLGSTRGAAAYEYSVPAGQFLLLHIGSAP